MHVEFFALPINSAQSNNSWQVLTSRVELEVLQMFVDDAMQSDRELQRDCLQVVSFQSTVDLVHCIVEVGHHCQACLNITMYFRVPLPKWQKRKPYVKTMLHVRPFVCLSVCPQQLPLLSTLNSTQFISFIQILSKCYFTIFYIFVLPITTNGNRMFGKF